MRGIFKNAWLYRGLRLLVSGIFLWSGTVKLMDPAAFAVVIDAFGLLPEGFSGVVALLLPLVEVAAALALLFDVRWSLETLGVLMFFFHGHSGVRNFFGA